LTVSEEKVKQTTLKVANQIVHVVEVAAEAAAVVKVIPARVSTEIIKFLKGQKSYELFNIYIRIYTVYIGLFIRE